MTKNFSGICRSLRRSAGACVLLASLAAPTIGQAALVATTVVGNPDAPALHGGRDTSTVSLPGDIHFGLHMDSALLEAGISQFSAVVGPAGGNDQSRVSEFSSFTVSTVAAPDTIWETEERNFPFRATGHTATGMPLMVLVWLFGVGLIGMNTVGRRKQ